jgi:ankyrin repeat protein
MALLDTVKLSPLHMAIMSGSCELVLLLLEHGADATATTAGDSQLTALELASSPAGTFLRKVIYALALKNFCRKYCATLKSAYILCSQCAKTVSSI